MWCSFGHDIDSQGCPQFGETLAHFARVHQIFLKEDVYLICSLRRSRGIIVGSGSHGIKVLDPTSGAVTISVSFPDEIGEFPIFSVLEAEDSGLLYVFSHEIPSRVICIDLSLAECTMVTGVEHMSLPAGWSLTAGPVLVLDDHGVWWSFSGRSGHQTQPPGAEVERLQALQRSLDHFEDWAILERRSAEGGVVVLNPTTDQVAWLRGDGSTSVIACENCSPVAATVCGESLLAVSESQLISRCEDQEVQVDVSGPDFYFVAVTAISEDPPRFVLLASAQDNRTSRLDLYEGR